MIATLVFVIISAIAKAFMDISSKDGFDNHFWNKTESWHNKYHMPLEKKSHWYYFGIIKPIYKESFPFSSTALVFLTDGWHLLQFISLNTIIIAISINMEHVLVSFIVIKAVHSIIFNTFYK